MNNVLLFVVCFLFACARFFMPHQAPSPHGTYQAFAHLLVGALIGAWLGSKHKIFLYLTVFLCAVELFAFFTR